MSFQLTFLLLILLLVFFKLFVIKHMKKDYQKSLKTVLKARVLLFDGPCKKLFKARLPDVYYGKF